MSQSTTSTLRPIEIGLIIAGELDDAGTQAIQQTQDDLKNTLTSEFSAFDWTLETVWRPELGSVNVRMEPVVLLNIAREERDARNWDFVFVITPVDLISHYKPFAFGFVSRSIDSAVISTSRPDPLMENRFVEKPARISTLARRLFVLIRQAFGQINSLEPTDDPGNAMRRIHTLADIDTLHEADWSPEQHEVLVENLRLIADVRLEEVPNGKNKRLISFYAHSAWLNRHEIISAIIGARPWEFPVRLNRLTTAALSSSLILIVTAESWELAVAQSLLPIVVLAVTAILVTTGYVTIRQQLLVRREQRISEQSVITNITAVAVVLLGMLTTYAVTFALLVGVATILFSEELVKRWTAVDQFSWQIFLVVPAMVASFSVIVGALGASFEEHHYFRHVIYVDEEI